MKKNIKIITTFILGIIATGTIAYAESVISGSSVGYSNSNSKLSATTVQGAIDEVYDKTFVKKQIVAYEYHETGANQCINGEEKTCKETKCYENKTAGSCSIGTVVKYYVSDWEFHYFYVLHDDGEVMTMQQRENTIRNIHWCSKEDYIAAGGSESSYGEKGNNIKGPLTVLNALEKATSTWTNVLPQTYTMGETSFVGDNYYTGCPLNAGQITVCTVNRYTLPERTARARLITVQEINEINCKPYSSNSCPIWIRNYSYKNADSSSNITVVDNTLTIEGYRNYGYWTMNTNHAGDYKWVVVMKSESVANLTVGDPAYGARAVVKIRK